MIQSRKKILTKKSLNDGIQKIWIANSMIGVVGIILNSLVLFIFFQERNKLVTSVNAMIM